MWLKTLFAALLRRSGYAKASSLFATSCFGFNWIYVNKKSHSLGTALNDIFITDT